MSAFAWIKAWEAAMAEGGYPRARCDVYASPDPERWGCTYTWIWDLDEQIDSHMNGGRLENTEAWEAAHMAFLLVEPLRPAYVVPSFQLARMLNAILPE